MKDNNKIKISLTLDIDVKEKMNKIMLIEGDEKAFSKKAFSKKVNKILKKYIEDYYNKIIIEDVIINLNYYYNYNIYRFLEYTNIFYEDIKCINNKNVATLFLYFSIWVYYVKNKGYDIYNIPLLLNEFNLEENELIKYQIDKEVKDNIISGVFKLRAVESIEHYIKLNQQGKSNLIGVLNNKLLNNN